MSVPPRRFFLRHVSIEMDTHYVDDGQEGDLLPFLMSDPAQCHAADVNLNPTVAQIHGGLPGFVEHFEKFHDKGIGVACMAVNDPFVMQAWGESQHVPQGLRMLSDGNGEFTRKLGLEMDASAFGMGVRSKRFALYAENGIVRQVFVEAPGEFRVSSAEQVLSELQ